MSERDDAAGPALREGRLSRWSRLKRQGGDGADNDTPPLAVTEAETAYAVPDANAMPGGAAIRRRQAPTMPSLVGEDDGPAPAPAPLPDPDAERELTKEEAGVVAGLPAIERLGKDSDFTPFLADKVPDFIRRRALSVLWRSDPVLANLDGLNDYDLNYRVIDTLIDVAKDTTYRVGKGQRTDEEEAEEAAAAATPAERQAEEAEAPAEEAPAASADVDAETAAEPAEPEDAAGADPMHGKDNSA